MNWQLKKTMTSLELVKEINLFREQEGNRSELKHSDLLKVIRDEFEDEINEGKNSSVEYKDAKGEMRPMFELTLSQSKQVLVRESKFVRKAVIAYIEKLETALKVKFQVPTTFAEALRLAAVQQEMKKQWPELTDYSLLLNLYMCVILIDFVRRFEQASSKVIQKATMNPYVAIENENMLHIRKACIEIAGKYKLPNTDMIRLGVKILAMNIDRMVKVEFD